MRRADDKRICTDSAPFGLAGKLAAGTLAAERLSGRSGDAMRVPGSMQPTFIKVLGAHEAAGAQKCAKKEATGMPRAGLCAGGEQRAPCADGLEAAQGAALGFPTLRCARAAASEPAPEERPRRGSEPPPVPNHRPFRTTLQLVDSPSVIYLHPFFTRAFCLDHAFFGRGTGSCR